MTVTPKQQAEHDEVSTTARNAVRLFGSLAVTLVVAFAVRFWLPRALGPVDFGVVHFAQEFTVAVFVLTTLGSNTYIEKEVSIRREHASDFFGGVLVTRIMLVALLALPVVAGLVAMGKSSSEIALVGWFAAGRFFFVTNENFAALLNANATVRELALANIVSKIVWGALIVGGISAGWGLWVVGAALLITEFAKAMVLFVVCRRRIGLQLRLDWSQTRSVLLVSIPFFLNYVAHHIGGNIDVTMISAMVSDIETGYYGAAINVTFIIYLVLPVLGSVLLPMSARLGKESPEVLNQVMRGAIRMILLVSGPAGIILALNATDVVTVLYGPDFDASTRALQILSVLVPVTYLAVLFSAYLIQFGKGWQVAWISVVGLVMNPVLNLWLLPGAVDRFGAGGAGTVAAMTTVASETTIVVLLFTALTRAGLVVVEARTALAVAKLAGIAVVIWVVNGMLPFTGLPRLLFVTVLYVVLAQLVGALPWREVLGALRNRSDENSDVDEAAPC